MAVVHAGNFHQGSSSHDSSLASVSTTSAGGSSAGGSSAGGSSVHGKGAPVPANLLDGSGEDRRRFRSLESTQVPPPMSLSDWQNSRAINLNDLRGKIVVLDFWATWCGPCLNAIPHNNELQTKYSNKGVVVIGVCNPNGSEDLKNVVRDYGIKYPVAVDEGKKMIGEYKVDAYPSYYLIDRKGRLRFADCRARSLEDAIVFLLNER